MSLEHLVEGPKGACSGLVVWLHGLGASGHDFQPLVPHLGLPDVRFVFPHAPEMPVTINNGYVMPAWYDIRSMEPGPEREDLSQLQASAAQVDALIAQHIASGAPADKVAILGFSQGGAVTMELLTRGERKFLGGMVLSSYLVEHHAPWTPANQDTQAWFAHGNHDDVVPAARGRHAFTRWQEAGRPAAWSAYPMAHEVVPQELGDLRAILQSWFKP